MRYPRGVRFHLLPILVLAAAPLFAGCINTDTAVFVDPSIDAPTVAIAKLALGTSLSGGFTLKLHLGARASGSSMVQPGQFEIQDAAQTKTIVTPLVLDAGGTALPVTVDQDSDVEVKLTFDTGTKLLTGDLGTQLCDAAGVVITGVIDDSLQNTATPVTSAVVHTSGCM